MTENEPTRTILAVDDDEITLEALEGFLHSEKTVVLTALNGEEALSIVNQNSIDLVLTDLQMPIMGGIELLGLLKNAYPDLPVIVVSGAGSLHDSVEAFHLGAWDFVLKPIDLPTIQNSVKRALERIALVAENKRYHDTLENKISQRTSELAQRTHELEALNKQLRDEIRVRQETERYQRQLEKEIQKARNLESLGSLAGGIAHDFNNLLSALSGYIDYASLISSSNPELAETLSNAKVITGMATDLTRQLITFSRGGSPILKRCTITNLIHQSIKMSAREAERITFQTAIPSSLWEIQADLDQLGIVLRNIYFNAIESMPNGGRLKTHAKNTVLQENNPMNLKAGGYLMISIEDQGLGIAKSDLQKIFDPYFTTKGFGSQKGKGLGLSVSLSIVKKHHGTITISSQKDVGTTVSLYLPACRDPLL